MPAEKLDQGPHCRGHISLFRIGQIPAGEVRREFLKHRHELAFCDQRPDGVFGPERNADTLQGGTDGHITAGNDQRAVDRDGRPVPIPEEFPVVDSVLPAQRQLMQRWL